MAKLEVLPELAVISGFKGVVDYYVYMGIPVARKWPRRPSMPRSPGVQAGYTAFTWAAQEWNNLDETTRAAYAQMASGTGLSPRDMFERSYIKGLFSYPTGG